MALSSHPNALLLLGDIAAVLSAGREEDSWMLGVDDIGVRLMLIRVPAYLRLDQPIQHFFFCCREHLAISSSRNHFMIFD